MYSREQRLAVIAMLVLGLSYGLAGFTARELQRDLGPWQQVALQSWLGFGLSLLVQRLLGGTVALSMMRGRVLLELAGRAVIGRILGSLFFILACVYAPLGNVAWISCLPASVLFAWLFLGQRISVRELSLLGGGCVGVGLIVNPLGAGHLHLGIGELYAVLSVLAIGLGSIMGRAAVHEYNASAATTWVILISAICSTVGAVLFEGGLAIPPIESLHIVALVTVMVVVGSTCSLYGFAHLPASTATALLTLEAVWAVAIGFFLYDEAPSVQGLVGGVIIAITAYAMKLDPKEQIGTNESESATSKC